MKKLILSVLAVTFAASLSHATGVIYTKPIFQGIATTTSTYTLNLNTAASPQSNASIDKLAMQVTSSGTPTNVQTFNDGQASTNSVTVTSNNMLAQAATEQITIAANTIIQSSSSVDYLFVNSTNGVTGKATDTVVVNSTNGLSGYATVNFYVNSVTGGLPGMFVTIGNTNLFNQTWNVTASSQTALSIAAQINGAFTNMVATVTTNASTITVTAVSPGPALNGTYIDTSTGSLAVSATAMNGGFYGNVSVNGNVIQNTGWNLTTTTTTALSIAAQINSTLSSIVTATATVNSTTVTITAVSNGPAANNYTLYTSSAAALTTSSSKFSGGFLASVTVNGVVVQNNGWRVDVASDTAFDIATQINSATSIVTSTNSVNTSTVTITSVLKDSTANAYTLASSTPAIVVSSPVFNGGQADAFRNQYLTINGIVYKSGLYWNVAIDPVSPPATSTGTALSIATFMNTLSGIQASASGSVVYATATVAGSAGNAFTVVSSTPAAMTVASPTFLNGQNVVTFIITTSTKTYTFTAGVTFSTGATTSNTATNLANALNTQLGGFITSGATANVVYSTANAVGLGSAYSEYTSSNAILTLNPPYTLGANGSASDIFDGGLNAAYTINTPTITIQNNGFVTGQAVYYTQGTQALTPLTNGTTYYVGVISTGNFGLATSTGNATKGTYVTLTSSSTTGPHTSTLTSVGTTGTATLAWYASNDCVNFSPITTAAMTLVSPYSLTTQMWDFGPVDWTCIQAQFTAPTTGGIFMTITPNGKN